MLLLLPANNAADSNANANNTTTVVVWCGVVWRVITMYYYTMILLRIQTQIRTQIQTQIK